MRGELKLLVKNFEGKSIITQPNQQVLLAFWWNGRRGGLKIHCLMRACRFESGEGHHEKHYETTKRCLVFVIFLPIKCLFCRLERDNPPGQLE